MNIAQFEFRVNHENNTIVVERTFAGIRQQIWDCWTKPELLDRWWAPLPYVNQTISMNFAEGGTWFYAMQGPDGDRHFCKAMYQQIQPVSMYSYRDGFCTETGEDLSNMPSTSWEVTFTAEGDATRVSATLSFDSLEKLETIIKMGFKEGFTIGMDQLDQLLASGI